VVLSAPKGGGLSRNLSIKNDYAFYEWKRRHWEFLLKAARFLFNNSHMYAAGCGLSFQPLSAGEKILPVHLCVLHTVCVCHKGA